MQYTTTKEFIALCQFNVNPQLDSILQTLSGSELQQLAAVVTIGIRRWLTRRSPSILSSSVEASGTSPTSASTANQGRSRSTTATKRARERDCDCCIISGSPFPLEVAHLFPITLCNNANDCNTEQPAFLELLRIFTGEAVARNVETYLGLKSQQLLGIDNNGSNPFPDKLQINRLENLMTMTADIHRLWDTGKIILEPIDDPLALFDSNPTAHLTTYNVRFSFLPSHRPPSSFGWNLSSLVQEAPLDTLQHTKDSDPILRNVAYWRRNQSEDSNKPTWTELQSGVVFPLTTPDPIKHPLPHPDLLSLHAALSRVVRCVAGAEEAEIDQDDDDNDLLDEEDWVENDSLEYKEELLAYKSHSTSHRTTSLFRPNLFPHTPPSSTSPEASSECFPHHDTTTTTTTTIPTTPHLPRATARRVWDYLNNVTSSPLPSTPPPVSPPPSSLSPSSLPDDDYDDRTNWIE